MKKSIGQTSCGFVRECKQTRCLLKMIQIGYVVNPKKQSERDTNLNIERSFGKGYYPKFEFVGKGNKLEIVCPDFQARV